MMPACLFENFIRRVSFCDNAGQSTVILIYVERIIGFYQKPILKVCVFVVHSRAENGLVLYNVIIAN